MLSYSASTSRSFQELWTSCLLFPSWPFRWIIVTDVLVPLFVRDVTGLSECSDALSLYASFHTMVWLTSANLEPAVANN